MLTYQQLSHTHYSTTHTLWTLTAATSLADVADTPPSPIWPKMCRVGR